MMNKKRLAALALSAVMAASTMSFPVYAADFSDGATAGTEVQVQSDFTSDAAGSANVEVQVAEPAEETVEAAGVEEDGDKLNNITFSYNGPDDYTATFYIGESKTPHTVEAEEWYTEPATCASGEKIWLKFTYDGVTHYSEEGLPTGKPSLGNSGHKMETVQQDYTIVPTHNKDGETKLVKKCAYCGKETTSTESVEKYDHTWGETVYLPDGENANVKTDDDGYVVFDSTGHAVLKDDTKDGHYKAVRYCTDSDCEAERKELGMRPFVAEDVEHKVEYAKTAYYAKIVEYDDENIADSFKEYVNKPFYNFTQQLPIDLDNIELKDCTVGGWYKVVRYNKEGMPISDKETIEVAPHHYHVYTTAEFTSKVDAAQCEVSHENGKLVVKNDSCYRPITYYAVSHCQAEGCNYEPHDMTNVVVEEWGDIGAMPKHTYHGMISRVAQTADPTGEHVYKKEIYNDIASIKYPTYAKLVDAIGANTDFVKLSEAPDCTVGGTVTVSYICVNDRTTVVKTQDVKLVPTDHVRDIPKNENEVKPTCEQMGSYEAVTDCKYCGTELERRAVQLQRLPHSNEDKDHFDASGEYTNDYKTDTTAFLKFSGDKVVDINGEALKGNIAKSKKEYEIGKNIKGEPVIVKMPYAGTYAGKDPAVEFKNDFGVSVWVYTECTECGKHEIALDKDEETVALKIADVQKESANGKAGSITLEATYKKANGERITETYTVPYFSTIEAYNGRLEEQPETPDEKLNGLHWDEDGECRYYVDGEFQKDFSGILEYEGKSFVLNNGVLCRTASGLNLIDDEWYYLTEGRIRTDVTQVVLYDDEWFYVTEGKLDTSVDDLVSYDGETFVYVDGRYAQEGNGLWIGEDGVWYFLSNGRVAKEHTGLAMYDNEWFYVVNGKLAVDFNGTVDFEGGTFKVVGGMVKEQVK